MRCSAVFKQTYPILPLINVAYIQGKTIEEPSSGQNNEIELRESDPLNNSTEQAKSKIEFLSISFPRLEQQTIMRNRSDQIIQ